MPLVRWDSLRNVSILQESINRLFHDAFPRSKWAGDGTHISVWRPVVDIFDRDQCLIIQAELPGLKREDVSIEVKERLLTIKGQRTPDKDIGHDRYYRRERSYGVFHRGFTLPPEIDPDHITARFHDGVLEIELPRPAEDQPKQISVTIG
jgi:HSP20 family protein